MAKKQYAWSIQSQVAYNILVYSRRMTPSQGPSHRAGHKGRVKMDATSLFYLYERKTDFREGEITRNKKDRK
jgi:hypothetical protein